MSDVSNGCLKDLVGDVDKKIVLPYNLVTSIGNIILIKPPANLLAKHKNKEKCYYLLILSFLSNVSVIFAVIYKGLLFANFIGIS